MGYMIQYEDTMKKIITSDPMAASKNKIVPILALMCGMLIVFSLLANFDSLRDFILPGNADITEAALAALVDNVRDGDSLGSAITVFCQDIIENANISK